MKRILQLFLLLGVLTGTALASHIDVDFTTLPPGDFVDITINPRALPISGSPIFSYVRGDNDAFARAGKNESTGNIGIYGSTGSVLATFSIIFPIDVLQVQGTFNWISASGTGIVLGFPSGAFAPIDMPSGQFTVAPGFLFKQLDIIFDDSVTPGTSDVNFELSQLSYDAPNAPEPASILLFGAGLLGLGLLRLRRFRA